MRYRSSRLWTAALLTALAAPAAVAEPIEAVTTAEHDLKLSFSVGGRVASQLVRPGSAVSKGQPLLALDDRIVAAELELRRLQAENDVAIRAAQAQLEMDQIELKRVEQLYGQEVASELELLRARATVNLRRLQLEDEQKKQELARKQYDQVAAQHSEYAMLAPTDGIIEKLDKEDGKEVSVGETVEAGRPVLRLVTVRTLRVDAAVPIADTLGLKVGDRLWVRARLANHDAKVEGRIAHIAQVSDSASNTRLVRIEVPNENSYLSAGWHVSIEFEGTPAGADARSPSPPAR